MTDNRSQSRDKYIYVVLSTPASNTGRAIGVITGDRYTHAAIAFDSSIGEMYSFGRKWRHFPFPGRLKKESMDTDIFERLDSLEGMILKFPVIREQYETAYRHAVDMYEHKKLYKYNYLGAMGTVFYLATKSKNRFTCSEFAAYILEICGAAKFTKPLNLIRPQDFLDLDGETVFSGDLKEYVRSSSEEE